MVGNITGMVRDGAKVGCAINGTCISSFDGIIDEDIEKTTRNLGAIGSACK